MNVVGILALALLYSLSHVAGLIWDVARIETCFFSPRMLYNTYQINWFGAIVIYLFYFITTPVYALMYIIKWICTVGRK